LAWVLGWHFRYIFVEA